jgi:hypothetical protein
LLPGRIIATTKQKKFVSLLVTVFSPTYVRTPKELKVNDLEQRNAIAMRQAEVKAANKIQDDAKVRKAYFQLGIVCVAIIGFVFAIASRTPSNGTSNPLSPEKQRRKTCEATVRSLGGLAKNHIPCVVYGTKPT